MNKNLGLLVAENLDLDLFYNASISHHTTTSLQGNYSEKLEKYILEKGFVMYDHLYTEEPDNLEYIKEEANIRILLIKNE